MTRDEYDATGGEDEYGPAEPLTPVFNLDGANRGHYITADYLHNAALFLEGLQLGANRHNLDDPSNPLRERVDKAKDEAFEAHARYHAHNELFGWEDSKRDYGADCGPACDCEYISDMGDDMDELLGDLGYVVEWHEGDVHVYEPLKEEDK